MTGWSRSAALGEFFDLAPPGMEGRTGQWRGGCVPDGDCEVVAATAGVEVKSFYKHTSIENETGAMTTTSKDRRVIGPFGNQQSIRLAERGSKRAPVPRNSKVVLCVELPGRSTDLGY
ncbi:hypothetical protein RRG08_043740 [Elysia crispata]|uniref:Uncharacterized protein n=1 Tax=Elysia crispata TaxID=231223 RepID=A0AAE0ZNL1_9GAST|nr:hypothetical protein RRG08_043740 [Elysia crispata]